MRVRIKKLMGNQDVLAGTAQGNLLLTRLLKEVPEPDGPEPLFLDFGGIEVATASFLRDGPLAYRQVVRSRGSRQYPVIANASPKVVDELRLFMESQNDAIFCCVLGGDDSPSKLRLIGRLDEKQAATLELVRKFIEVDIATLVDSNADPDIKPTAWNNRLAALVGKGLVMESTSSRAKRFRLSVQAQGSWG